MYTVFFIAILGNCLDLLGTAVGIFGFGNREGNWLLADMAHNNWPLFVLVKGVLTPLLIVSLYYFRHLTPRLAMAGMSAVAVAETVAVGQWIGWIAGVVHVNWMFSQ